MDTKMVGDIAEQAVLLEAMKRGWDVLRPIGDRLAYDLVIVANDKFIKVQVKSAYWNGQSWICNARRAKTNRKEYKYERYSEGDFDFAVLYVPNSGTFFVMPIAEFLAFKSGIALPVGEQAKGRASPFREKWELIA